MAEAGPVPHDPAEGKVVSFEPKSPSATEVASGAPLLVDVEFGRARDLYALSQGSFGGERGRHVQHRLRPLGPADLGRIHQEHRARGHAHRGDLEGREPLGPAARRVALRHQDSEAATPDAVKTAIRGRLHPGHRREHYPEPPAARKGASWVFVLRFTHPGTWCSSQGRHRYAGR
jgi:hypothetical protein